MSTEKRGLSWRYDHDPPNPLPHEGSCVGGKQRAMTGGRYGEDRTQQWRVAVRGNMRFEGDKLRAKRNTPEAWERRKLASLPGAQFDASGKLSNAEEMRAVARARGKS